MGTREPNHFFAVELRGISRHRNDSLLNSAAVSAYLSQIAPIPFSPTFRFADPITSFLAAHVPLCDLRILISDHSEHLFRPHRNEFEISAGTRELFSELEFITVPGLDGGLAGFGWILHHDYRGAIPAKTGLKGLRLRNGNIQVGDDRLLEELFAESRFNAWAVGEIHVIDPRIIPNGRRDHYEQNVHFHNLVNHLSPFAREISHRCRTNSIARNRLREFDRLSADLTEKLIVIRQGTLGLARLRTFHADIREGLARLEKMTTVVGLAESTRRGQCKKIASLRRKHDRLLHFKKKPRKLLNMAAQKRSAYQKIFDLIYECSTNNMAAATLVQRILSRL